MRNSKIVISCVTKSYSQSTDQQSELELAKELKKPIIALMLEDLKLIDVPEIWNHIGHLRRANLFIDSKGLKSWSGKLFDEVILQIKLKLENIEKKNVNIKTKAIERRVPIAPTLPNKSILTKNDIQLPMTISLPKSAKHLIIKCLDLFKLKNYARLSDEIEQKGLIMNQNDLNIFIDSLIGEYADLVESERQQLIDIKTLNLSENRIFYLDKVFENDFSKIVLFIFKRKYNGRYQVYLCATKKSYDLKKYSEILKSLYALDNSRHTVEFLEEMKLNSNKTLSKVFLISFLIEEMISHFDQTIKIDWDKDFKFYPNEATSQRPQVNNLNEIKINKTLENDSFSLKNNNVVIKLPSTSQSVIEKCKELYEKFQPDRSNQAVKFEKFVIESVNIENFINQLFSKYPHVTDNEKLNIYKLKNLNTNEARSIFIETYNAESCVKLTLLIVRLSSNNHFKIISVETKAFLRLLDITEIFSYFYRIKESQQTLELFQHLEAIQTNKKINKSLIKFFLVEQFKHHFNEPVEIQWEQLIENKTLPPNTENRIGSKTQEKSFENRSYVPNEPTNRHINYLNVMNDNHSNLEDLKKMLPLVKLPIDGKEFLEICEDFIQKHNLQPSYKKIEHNTANIKRAHINKYIDKLLDDYFFSNDHEKDSITEMKHLSEGEKKCAFIEISTHVSSKFVIILCSRQSNINYQFQTCEDTKYHELFEFENLFFEIYRDLKPNKEIVVKEFLESIKHMTNLLNSKVFLLNFMIKKLNENFKENLAIDWIT